MRITRVATRVVDFPLRADFRLAWARGGSQDSLLIAALRAWPSNLMEISMRLSHSACMTIGEQHTYKGWLFGAASPCNL